jgi:hypothetical protein
VISAIFLCSCFTCSGKRLERRIIFFLMRLGYKIQLKSIPTHQLPLIDNVPFNLFAPCFYRVRIRARPRGRLFDTRLRGHMVQSQRRGLYQGHHPRLLRSLRLWGCSRPQLRFFLQQCQSCGVHRHRYVLVPMQWVGESVQIVCGTDLRNICDL